MTWRPLSLGIDGDTRWDVVTQALVAAQPFCGNPAARSGGGVHASAVRRGAVHGHAWCGARAERSCAAWLQQGRCSAGCSAWAGVLVEHLAAYEQ
jgi:hypothetical protein|uniref:B1168G10.15 protein n=1 Tax=Oryza sativa subsp. japonica TaxID=39947 RepID=Q5H9V5_ORYSJ|nr:B1168G10.15 [Oryza sativa Japonica Group]